MICSLCWQPVDLFDLDDEGWSGEPAHRRCADAARLALSEALIWIAAERRRQSEVRAARRGGRADAA